MSCVGCVLGKAGGDRVGEVLTSAQVVAFFREHPVFKDNQAVAVSWTSVMHEPAKVRVTRCVCDFVTSNATLSLSVRACFGRPVARGDVFLV